jgi:hypothetical protein
MAAGKVSMPKWVLVAICAAAIGLGLAFNLIPGSSSNHAVEPLNQQPLQASPK